MFKKFLESKGISQEDFAAKSVEEMAQLRGEYEDARAKELEEKIAKMTSQEAFDALETAAKDFMANASDVSNEAIKSLKQVIKTQGEAITEMKEKIGKTQTPDTQKTLSQVLKETIEANKDAYEELKEQKGARMKLTIKAAGTILTSTNLTPAGNRIARTETQAERVGFVRRNPFMLDLVTVGNTNAKTIYWVELVNEDGTVAMTAEGAVKSQVDYDYVEASATVRKATAFMKISKEMLDDVDNFAADMERELTERIALFIDDQILNGDGTGENLVGVDTNATAFAAGTALAASVEGAQEADCLRAAIAQVVRSQFYPTACVVHPDIAARMDLLKATDGQYVVPPFKSASGLMISGIPVIVNTNVGIDDFYVGDFSKYIVKIKEDIDIQIGYDGDDWTKNLLTPLAEMRLVGYIPANHYGAIVTGTFTAAKAALETV